jgi:peptidyl-prolyl cis-trans isomerase C
MPPPPVNRPPADELAFTLNGKKFTEGDVEKAFRSYTAGAQGMTEDRIAMMLQRQHGRIVDSMIDEELMKNEADRLKVKLTDAEVDEGIEKLIGKTLRDQGMTREQFEEQVKKNTGQPLADYIKAIRPRLEKQVVADKISDALFKDLEVKDEEVRQQYDNSPAYGPKIKVSHILCKVENKDPQDKKDAARKKAEEVLVEAKKPGADFAELAKKYSDCPSKAKGGELPEFLPSGKIVGPGGSSMLPEFAKAAFALKPGEISDVVETKFGYHVIKAASKQDAKPFEEVKAEIVAGIKSNKGMMKLREHLKELKDKADITYPPGKQPMTQPAFPPPPTTTRPAMPMTRPAMPPTAGPKGGPMGPLPVGGPRPPTAVPPMAPPAGVR